MQIWDIVSALPSQWKTIADWLVTQNNPPKSYSLFPFNSEAELLVFKKDFQKALGISLGKYVRLRRVDYLLHQINEKFKQALSANYIETPLGEMLESELLALQKNLKANFIFQTTEQSIQLTQELSEYFAGERKNFSIPLDIIGTEFQKSVWQALLNIPYGSTSSYKLQAESMGKLSAIRAIAAANGRNQISIIIIPCHRVIGSDGDLVGYGGGVDRKRALLKLEKTFN
ncbi:methylated-DNA--[protein]-cysteine S-methyltransferase [Mannheimia pernigra]|uniref:methylated-DNA--[protein]-cysteine S-methyltransferase n=1 Tax=Mannheimia pernigra TaxID=111844 RepID=UPI0013198E04|nr:methylated-DNA--[protein]-cysteine S-methyltransferase [Mannheimia pernigra]QHB17223.1 methylated-DNA--[protein]-cysteine S-methyltransferase [Mannheimia pernigra]